MNCREFRLRWKDDADDAVLAHWAECEDCLQWLEETEMSDEEVLFMREFPQPSAQLEDRIMRAIYETARQGTTPPVSAAMAAMPAPSPSNRRLFRRYPAIAWVGAAAILLATGFYSWENNLPDQQEIGITAYEQPAAENSADGTEPSANQAPEAIMNDPAQPEIVVSQPADGAPAPGQAQTTPETAAPETASETLQTPAVNPQDRELALVAPPVSGSANPKGQSNEIAARSAGNPAATKNGGQQADTAASVGENANMATLIAEPVAGDAPAAQPQEQPQNSMASIGEASGKTADVIGPEQPQLMSMHTKQAITVSTFTDVETARQASDLPIPSSAQLPEGFALSSVSLQYESETSQRVTHVSLLYHRNGDAIKIDVKRHASGEPQLSVPGSFAQTKVFTIAGEQAVGVTYTADSIRPEGAAEAQHAVHFYSRQNGHSLQIVISGSGVTLDEIINLAKQLTWTPSS